MEKKKLAGLLIAIILTAFGLIKLFYFDKLNQKLAASGTIEVTEIVVSSKAIGKVLDVKVEEGQKVSEGALLAEIDPREARARLKSAQAQADLAKNDLERYETLYNDQLISPQQYQAAQTANQAAEAALELAQIQLDNTQIKSPLSGTVLVKAIEKGELANIGTPIATIADLSLMTLTVYLSEREIGKIKLGQKVFVSCDAFLNQKFEGQVSYISDQAEFTPKNIQTKDERVTLVFGIKIKIPNPEYKLKPGMPADAEF